MTVDLYWGLQSAYVYKKKSKTHLVCSAVKALIRATENTSLLEVYTFYAVVNYNKNCLEHKIGKQIQLNMLLHTI